MGYIKDMTISDNVLLFLGTSNLNIMKRLCLILVFISLISNTSFSQKPELIVPIGHTADILTCCYSPDGNYILSGGCDNILILWEVASGKQVKTFWGHSDFVTFTRFSPDGRQIISCSDDGTAKLWDVATAKELRTFSAKKNNFSQGCFSENGKRLLLCEQAQNAFLFDLPSGSLIWQAKEDKDIFLPRKIQFVSNETKVLIAFPQNKSCLYDIATSKKIYLGVNGILTFRDGNRISSDYGLSDISKCEPDPNYDIKTSHFNCKLISSSLVINDYFSGASVSTDDKHIVAYDKDHVERWIKNDKEPLKYELKEKYISDTLAVIDTADCLNLYTYFENVAYNPIEEKIFCVALSDDGRYYVTGGTDNILRVYDFNTTKLLHEFRSYSTHVNTAVFSPDGNTLAQGSSNNTIKLWSFREKVAIETINTDYPVTKLCYSTDGKRILSANLSKSEGYPEEEGIFEWNILTRGESNGIGFITKVFYDLIPDHFISQPVGNRILTLQYMPGEKSILCLQNFNMLSLLNDSACTYFKFKSGKELLVKDNLRGGKGDFFPIHVGEKYLSFRKEYHNFSGYNIGDPRLHDEPFDALNGAAVSADGKIVITGSDDWKMRSWDTETRTEIKSIKTSSEFVTAVALSPDGSTALCGGEKGLELWDLRGNRKLKTFTGHNGIIINVAFSPDGKTIMSNGTDNTIKLWDGISGSLIHTLTGHVRWPDQVSFSPDGRQLLSGSIDNTMKLWSCEKGKEIATFISIDTADWVITTPEMYYTTSKSALSLMGWKVGNKVYNFEQFDLQYNRPDIVLEKIGRTDSSIIRAYRKAYEKRLRKMNIDEAVFSPDLHTPEIKILNRKGYSYSTDLSPLPVKICGTDSKYKLDRLNIWVNEVPLFGTRGLSVKAENSDSVSKNISVDLSAGKNKIQVSCINEKGVESLKETFEIDYLPGAIVKPDLYVIAIGASEYRESKWNLNYASKDANDFSGLLGSQKERYRNIYLISFLNQQVKSDSIKKVRQKLLKSNVDDVIVVFYAGHGMLDENLDYCLATYEMDFNKPVEKGLRFEDFDNMLDSVPARNKIIFIDACHSGEVDKDEELLLADNRNTNENVVFRSGGSERFRTRPNLSYKNSFELMKELFADLRKGNGTVVISSAGAGESAFEGKDWNNGVFTYSILEGLMNRFADLNKDGQISVSELKTYVSDRVQKLTNGRQNPTSRKENLEFDFRIW